MGGRTGFSEQYQRVLDERDAEIEARDGLDDAIREALDVAYIGSRISFEDRVDLIKAVLNKALEEHGSQLRNAEPLEPCEAVIWHGPGHQSKTKCQMRGAHEIHRTLYGSGQILARWKGDETHSGFFDEPPEDPEEVEDDWNEKRMDRR